MSLERIIKIAKTSLAEFSYLATNKDNKTKTSVQLDYPKNLYLVIEFIFKSLRT